MKLEFYGHKREGYSLSGLWAKLRGAGFRPTARKTYAKFFSELFELILNFFYIKFLAPDLTESLRDGRIRPTTADEFSSQRKAFRLYAVIYPFVWLTSQLDRLLFFLNGYCQIVWAKKC